MKKFISVYVFGGIINNLQLHDTLEEAKKEMVRVCEVERFDPDVDDARIFSTEDLLNVVYSYDPEEDAAPLNGQAKTIAPKFELGETVMTRGVDSLIKSRDGLSNELYAMFLKHVQGDWGIVSEEDKEVNEEALPYKDRVMSAYMLGDQKIWIITEAGHSLTTALLPEEY